jgi:resuscitation-promoting factor RpfB
MITFPVLDDIFSPYRNSLLFRGLLVIVLVGLVTVFAGQAGSKVMLQVDGVATEFRIFGGDVKGLLTRAEVEVTEDDWISHQFFEQLTDGMIIEVKKAFPVTVLADGDEHIIKAAASTVADVLNEVGINLTSTDRVEPQPEHVLERGDVIRVTRVYSMLTTIRTEIPFREIRRANVNMDRGATRLVQAGSSGLREDTFEITFEDGIETESKLLQSDLVTIKQDRIVESGENTVLSRAGRTVHFDRVKNFLATAYCPGTAESGCPVDHNGWSKCTGKYNDGFTFTGRRAVAGNGTEEKPHIIAVDPKVIPLGSRVYIDGYGFAIAADIGSAIQGNRIDLLFNSHDVAWLFGRKQLRVYLLP